MSDDKTTLRPESPLNGKPRETGWYHVKYMGNWIIAAWTYNNEEWRIPFSDGYWYEGAFSEIDERRITREEPIAAKISGTTERIPQNE